MGWWVAFGRSVTCHRAGCLPLPCPEGADELDAKLGGAMVKLFDQHAWAAHLPDLGGCKELPLLTKIAGGVQAWTGDSPRVA